MPEFNTHDPDHLVALISRLPPPPSPPLSKPKPKSSILNSLAHLAGACAIGAVAGEGIIIELVIAPSSPTKSKSKSMFLKKLFEGLVSEKEEEELDLDMFVIHHTLPKFHARFKKRYPAFRAFIEHQQGEQKERIEELARLMGNLDKLLDFLVDRSTSEHLLRCLVVAIQHLLYIGESGVLEECRAYIKSEFSCGWIIKFEAVDSLADLDVERWVGKLTSTQVHLAYVRSVARAYLERPIHLVELDVPILSPTTFTFTREAFSRDWGPGLLFDALRIPEDDDPDEITFDVGGAAHAECVVLENLRKRRGLGAWYEVGVSKPSCGACEMYFKVRDSTFSVRSGEFPVGWRCVSEDEGVREAMCRGLRKELFGRVRRLRDESARRGRARAKVERGGECRWRCILLRDETDGVLGEDITEMFRRTFEEERKRQSVEGQAELEG